MEQIVARSEEGTSGIGVVRAKLYLPKREKDYSRKNSFFESKDNLFANTENEYQLNLFKYLNNND